MKGTLAVREVLVDPLGVFIAGTVVSGHLMAGMEARYESVVIVIRELYRDNQAKESLKTARIGHKVILKPALSSKESLANLKGVKLHFVDVRSLPIKDSLLTQPDLI